jgi:hypothetical protein
MKSDVFISHASEDKDMVVRPLAEILIQHGFTVWYDQYVLRLGDSLREQIDQGLATCRFGIVILSRNFFSKEWPQRELNGLVARESSGNKIILPIWHEITQEEIGKYSPILADKVAVSTSKGLDIVANQILDVLNETEEQEQNQKNTDAAVTPRPQDIERLASLSEKVLFGEQKKKSSYDERSNLSRLKNSYKVMRWRIIIIVLFALALVFIGIWNQILIKSLPTVEDPTIIDLYPLIKDEVEVVRFLDLTDGKSWNPNTRLSEVIRDISQSDLEFLQTLQKRYTEANKKIQDALATEPPYDGTLEIISVSPTEDAELDVKLRNVSGNTVYITRIIIRILKDIGFVLPILKPSAEYAIPVGSLVIGGSKEIEVSHVIEPHQADRFLIALDTTRILLVRMTLEYNKSHSVSENVWLWLSDDSMDEIFGVKKR